MFKLLAILLPVILGGLGLFQAFIYILIKRKFHRFGRVAGVITYSKFLNYTDTDGKREIGAIIKYKYSVRGVDYEGDTPLLKGYDMFPSYKYYDQLVDRYPPGETVNVHFFRGNPELAYLEVAPLSKLSTILAPALSIGAIAILVAYVYGVGDLIVEWLKEVEANLYIDYYRYKESQ